MFVDRQDKLRLELKFILAATSDFCSGIDFFEQKQAHVHNTRQKLEEILVGQLRKFVDKSELNNIDDDGELSRKNALELIQLDIDKVEALSSKKIFIGQEAERELKNLGLSPQSVQIRWFFDQVKVFHITAAKYLQKYFKVALSDSAMENMASLHPKNQSSFK